MRREGRTPYLLFVVVVAIIMLLAGISAIYTKPSGQGGHTRIGRVSLLATSRESLFVGASSDNSSLYVGFLNGTVAKMDPQSGSVVAAVTLPDKNAAAHLVYYGGSLYVGTERLQGARNTAPYHVYRIEPGTLRVLAQLAMTSTKANGFVFAFNGYLWAGDGSCNLYRIELETLKLNGTVPRVAEDEMTYDGTYYWTECRNIVYVLGPGPKLPIVAAGTMPTPGRPRGFFELGGNMYSSSNVNFTLYRMSISERQVLFDNVGTLGDRTLQTRDAFLYGGLFYAYETNDYVTVPARVFVFDVNLGLKAVVPLPGHALPTDASQHTLLLINGLIYFVTDSAIGYFAPLDASAL